jgi:hypothetical protein
MKEFTREGEKIRRQEFACGVCNVNAVAESNETTGVVSIAHDDPKCDTFTAMDQSDGHAVADFMRIFIEAKQAKLRAEAEERETTRTLPKH